MDKSTCKHPYILEVFVALCTQATCACVYSSLVGTIRDYFGKSSIFILKPGRYILIKIYQVNKDNIIFSLHTELAQSKRLILTLALGSCWNGRFTGCSGGSFGTVMQLSFNWLLVGSIPDFIVCMLPPWQSCHQQVDGKTCRVQCF